MPDELAPGDLLSGGDVSVPLLGFPRDANDADRAPLLLSDTGAFSDLGSLEVADGFLSYRVQSPLYSDGASKQRWLSLPPEGQIGFSADAAWTFPEGTVFAKHFGMVLDERYPEEEYRLETRFLIAARGGSYYGLVYKWDEDQAEARLISEGGEEQLEIFSADGSPQLSIYTYPAQSSCGMCHSAAAGYVMGVRTAQINAEPLRQQGDDEAPGSEPMADLSSALRANERALPSRPAVEVVRNNQLTQWSELGLFGEPLAADELPGLPRLAPLADESVPVEHRVRSYWDSNCSMCHNPASPPRTWDARIGTPLAEQAVISVAPRTPRSDGSLLVTPGDPEHSLLYLRVASNEPGVRMPPVLRTRVDDAYVELLEQWIVSLAP